MQWIVIVQRAEEARPTFRGPFSSFQQALEWIGPKLPPYEPGVEEINGIDIGYTNYKIRALYRP